MTARLALYRVTLTFGRIVFSKLEESPSETYAIHTVQRYARALGYSGHPDRTESRRIH